MKKVAPTITFAALSLAGMTARAYEWPGTSCENPLTPAKSVGVNVSHTCGEDTLKYLVGAGVHLVRIPFRWSEICKVQDNGQTGPVCSCNWSTVDNIVNWCADHNIRILASLDGIPTEDPNQNPCVTTVAEFETFQSGFGQFVADAVDRYKGRDFIWELWNEPNFVGSSNPSVDQYMALANWWVSPPIRQWDPTASFVGPALSDLANPDENGDPLGYLEALFNYRNVYWEDHLNGLLDTVDGITVHPYRGSNPETVIDHYSQIRSLINYYTLHGAPVPILSGEWGYPDTSSSTTPEYCGASISRQTQADYTARMLLINLSEKVPVSIVYQIIDGVETDATLESHFGLLWREESAPPTYHPKPSYYALKTLNSSLDNAHFYLRYAPESVPANDYLMLFRTPRWGVEREVLAAWTTNAIGLSMVRDDPWWGSFMVTGTPIYLGSPLAWNGNSSWFYGFGGGWPNEYTEHSDNWQAKFDQVGTVNVDGEYFVSGLQFNAPSRVPATSVTLAGGKLKFTPGGGNLYVGSGFNVITSVLADAYDRGTEPPIYPNAPGEALAYTNTPETFVLRKSGAGEVGLSGTSTFHGRVLVGEGILDLDSDKALGDLSNPLTLAGGGIDLNGRNLTTGPLTIVGDSTIYNYGSTASTYTPASFDISKGNLSLLEGSPIRIGSPVSVHSGGTLSGTASVGALVVDGGVVSPGVGSGSVGKMVVGSSVTFKPGSVLNIELGATSGSCDSVAMGGNLTLGGKLNISAIGLNVSPGSYTILGGARRRTGMFSEVKFPTTPLRTYSILYGPTSVIVSVKSSS